MTQRPALPQDAPLLYRLFALSKAAEFAAAGMPEAVYRPLIELQYRGRALTYAAQHPAAETWVITREGIVIGQYTLAESSESLRLIDFAVLPQHQGQGIATEVLEQLQQRASALGQVIGLRVTKQNPALRLYNRLGFRHVSDDDISYELVWP